MKPKSIIILALITSFTGLSLQAMELGDVALAGNGCYGSTNITPISAVPGRISLPIRSSLNKKAQGAAFERKSCNIRIPVRLASNEKLQILDTAQSVRLSASRGTEVKSTLSLSLVGRKTPDLILTVKAEDKNISLVKVLRSEKSLVLAESDCGEDTIIAGNSNIIVTGENQASVTTGSANITLRVVSCGL